MVTKMKAETCFTKKRILLPAFISVHLEEKIRNFRFFLKKCDFFVYFEVFAFISAKYFRENLEFLVFVLHVSFPARRFQTLNGQTHQSGQQSDISISQISWGGRFFFAIL